MLSNMRIGPRMILVGIILIILPLAAVTTITLTRSGSSITEVNNERLLAEARVSAHLVRSVYAEENKLLLTIANDPDIVAALARPEGATPAAREAAHASAVARARAKLATIGRDQRMGGSYESLALLDADGTRVADGYTGSAEMSRSAADVVRKALAGQESAGTAMVSASSGRAVMPLAVPVMAGGRFAGALLMVMKIDFLRDLVAEEKIGKTGYMFVVDSSGLIIAHPDPAEIMKVNMVDSPSTHAFGTLMVEGKTAVLGYTSTKGVRKIGACAPVPGLGWSVAMSLPESESQAVMVAREVRTLTLLVGCIALVVCLVVYVFFSRSITTPLHEGMRFAEKVASGDFTGRLSARGRDEVASLVTTLSSMAERLRGMVVAVQRSAEQLAAASGEISSSAHGLADGAQGQAATIEETSAALEQLTASVDQVAEHARRQAGSVKDGAESMGGVRRSIEEAAEGLARIENLSRGSVARSLEGSQAVARVMEGITAIAESSERIGGITTVISEIADQTNLLSLNASIEAARAGENGRGFAVVAAEVSKLAERSAAAAREIDELIRESVRNVRTGVETSGGARRAMDEIQGASQAVQEMVAGLSRSTAEQVEGVASLNGTLARVNEMSQNISAATDEQSSSMRQVSRAMESINEVTQATADSAQQMSSAVERVSAMARELQGLVDQLTVDSGKRREADYFPWTDALSLDIPVIDGQHHRLVDMVNALYRGMVGNEGPAVQKRVIHEMVDYATTHFALEEEYMLQFSFEGREAHARAHAAFTARALDLRKRSDASGFVLTMEIIDFLRGWLQEHIMGTDRQYRECFLKNRVA